jgi:hypothetical protein
MKPLLVCAALATIAATSVAQAPSRSATSVILGIVEDSSARPIAGADVGFAGYQLRATTDSLGRFRIVNVPSGKFAMVVRGIGYRPIVNDIDVRGTDTLRLTFLLQRTANELATVLVTERTLSPKLREFEERRKLGFGQFFTRADIDKINPVGVSDILRRSVSIRIRGDRAMSARQWPDTCEMSVYVDQIPLGRVKLDQLPSPNEIAAIEVYPGSATLPIWLPNGPLGSSKGCGAILLWTRDGSSGEFHDTTLDSRRLQHSHDSVGDVRPVANPQSNRRHRRRRQRLGASPDQRRRGELRRLSSAGDQRFARPLSRRKRADGEIHDGRSPDRLSSGRR